MPIYPYLCNDCSYHFEIPKPLANIEDKELCEDCGSENTERTIGLTAVEASSAQQPYYNPGLGCVINSKSHKKQVMKQLGVEEVGTTSPESMYKQLEVPREKRIAESWDRI